MRPARDAIQHIIGRKGRASGIWAGVFLVIWAVGAAPVLAQSALVRGFVTAASDGEALQGVNVTLDGQGGRFLGAVSDGDGFFLIPSVPPGRYRLRASFIGFEAHTDTLELEAGEAMLVDVALRDAAVELQEVAVEAERETGGARVTAGRQTIRPEEIEHIPAPDVSGDLVSYLSALPGVVLMGDRGGQVFIRGGEATHNLTLLDGMDVYQPFHMLGFYSAFPAEVISRADVYAGGFGGRFTGRLSSVIDVQSRNGNKRGFGAMASVSPFTGAGRLEGPLVKDHVSFLGAARFSMLEQLASAYVAAPLPYVFNDLFGKVHARYGSYQVSFTALNTYDRGTLSAEDDPFQLNDEIRWRNRAYGLRYLVTPSVIPVLGELLVSYSGLHTELGPGDAPQRASRMETVNVAVNMTHYGRRMETNWGFSFRTPALEAELGGLFQDFDADRYRSPHTGAYLEPEVYLGRGLYVRPGLSVQVYGDAGGFFEPRLRLRWERGVHHWSAAGGLYHQAIVGISDRRDATNLFAAWVGAPAGAIPRAVHALLGYRVAPAPWLEASVEGFYKRLDHLAINEWTAFPGFTTRLQPAHGRAAGFDLRLEVRGRRFYGLLNYGFSSTRYELEPENPLADDPGAFRPPHDRRHQVNLLGNAQVRGFDLRVRWQFGSGLPYTRIEGFDGFILMDGAVDVGGVPGFPRVIYEREPYRGVLPTYHRLDVSVERTFATGGAAVTLQAGVLNAYDRANLFTLDLFTGRRSDQLPLVPFAGLKIER